MTVRDVEVSFQTAGPGWRNVIDGMPPGIALGSYHLAIQP